MWRRILFYGLASGIFLIFLFMIFFATVENVCEIYSTIPMWGYGFMALAFMFALPAANKYKKRNHKAGLAKTFGAAFLVCLISGLVFSVYAFIHFDTPEVEDDTIYTDCAVLDFDYEGMGKEAIGLEFLRFGSLDNNLGNAGAQTAILFLTTMVVGVLISLGAVVVASTVNQPKKHR